MTMMMGENQKEDGRSIEKKDSLYRFSKLGEKTWILS